VVLTWSAPDVTAAMTDDCEKYVPFSISRAARGPAHPREKRGARIVCSLPIIFVLD